MICFDREEIVFIELSDVYLEVVFFCCLRFFSLREQSIPVYV